MMDAAGVSRIVESLMWIRELPSEEGMRSAILHLAQSLHVNPPGRVPGTQMIDFGRLQHRSG